MQQKPTHKPSYSWFWKYAALTTQFFIAIIATMYIGWLLDGYLSLSFPIAIWVLPLLTIIGTIIKIMIDTNRSAKNKQDE